MQSLLQFFREIGFLIVESSPYLLLGFSIAGLIHTLLPTSAIQNRLGKNDFRSVLRAALWGVPLPLCSCSVIPTAVSLKQAGASKGATSAFLISTPETGVDSIGITWALMDPIMTVIRPLAALMTAVATGMGVNLLVTSKLDGEATPADSESLADSEAPCCANTEPDPPVASCCEDPATKPEQEAPAQPGQSWVQRIRASLQYAFGALLDDLVPWFTIGLIASGLIAVLAPENLFTELIPSGWPAMLLMLVIGTPLYICATASTPIAVTLIAKGLDPGAALVFLLVGPATNVTTLIVVSKMLGKRVLGVYLITVSAVALIAGFGVNQLYSRTDLDLVAAVNDLHEHGPGWLGIVSGIVLVSFSIRSAFRIQMGRRFANWILRRKSEPQAE